MKLSLSYRMVSLVRISEMFARKRVCFFRFAASESLNIYEGCKLKFGLG